LTGPARPGAPETGEPGLDWTAWVGREERQSATVSRERVCLLEASLDRPGPGEGNPLAPLRHWLWLFAPPATETRRLDPDGHAPRGPLVPTWPLPRRMWAGSTVTWQAPIALDAPLDRHSCVASVEIKRGRSGTLGFMTLRHQWHSGGQCAIDERQTVVYREAPGPDALPGSAPPAPRPANSGPVGMAAPGAWSGTLTPSEVLLFRYSALTFNSHRIHYDRDYACGVEGYPGLVVHGPLMATLMLDAFRDAHPGVRLRSFSFRALAPAFVGTPLTVGGEPADGGRATLWVRGADDTLHVAGEALAD